MIRAIQGGVVKCLFQLASREACAAQQPHERVLIQQLKGRLQKTRQCRGLWRYQAAVKKISSVLVLSLLHLCVLCQELPPFPDGSEDATNVPPPLFPPPIALPKSYPTNITLRWKLLVPSDGGYHQAAISLSPAGRLYVPINADTYGIDVDNSANRLWCLNPAQVDPNNPDYPSCEIATNWVKNFTNYGGHMTPVVGVDETVYADAQESVLSAFNPTNGNTLWTFSADGLRYYTASFQGEPAIGNDGTIYVASGLHVFALTNAFGSTNTFIRTNTWYSDRPEIISFTLTNVALKWEALYPSNNPAVIPSSYHDAFNYSSPVVDLAGTVFVNSFQGQLLAFDSTNGALKWVTTQPEDGALIGNATSPAILNDGTVVFGSGYHLLAVDPNSPTTNGIMGYKWIWRGTTNLDGLFYDTFPYSPVVGLGGKIYIEAEDASQSRSNRLICLNSGDQTVAWEIELASPSGQTVTYAKRSSVAIAANGEIYVSANTGVLYSFSPDGRTNWTYQVNEPEIGGPLIGPDGTVYIATYYEDNGGRAIYAFAGQSPISCGPWPMHRKNARRTGTVATANLFSPVMTANGFQMNLAGISNLPVCLCASTDLVDWTNTSQIILTNETATILDASSTNYPMRFYFAKPQ